MKNGEGRCDWTRDAPFTGKLEWYEGMYGGKKGGGVVHQ